MLSTHLPGRGRRVPFEPADFGPPSAALPPTAAVAAAPELADAELTNAAELRGKVAVVWRGGCPFLDKARRAQAAGAVAVIVVNNDSRNTLWKLYAVANANVRNANQPQADDIRVPVLCVGQNDGAEFLRGVAVAFEYDVAVRNWMLVVEQRDGQIHCGPIQRSRQPDGLYDMDWKLSYQPDWKKLQNMNPYGLCMHGMCMVLFTRQQSDGTWVSVCETGIAKARNNVKDFVLRLGQADHGRPASIYDLPLGRETVGSAGILDQPRLTSQNPAFHQQATRFVAPGPASDPFNQSLGGWGILNQRMQPVNGASPQLLHKAVLSNLGCCACCKPEVVQKRQYAYM
jgi:hypothetical protein